jgi:hypothetical protein
VRACLRSERAESFFSLIKRGFTGNVSCRETSAPLLRRIRFRWDTRKLNDGERVVEAVKRAEGWLTINVSVGSEIPVNLR